MNTMVNLLKNSGLKTTVQRQKILKALQNSKNKHISAEELYTLLKFKSEGVPLATIYRVLSQLEAIGLVKKHNFEDNRAFFELTVGDKHHDHLICNKCGIIIEFFDELIEERQIMIADLHKFKITDHSLSIFGVCSSCLDGDKVVIKKK